MKIKNCRSCESKKLVNLYSLGNQHFTGIFPSKINSKIPRGNLRMLMCNNCKLLQLDENFDSNEMYGDNYGYMSSLNKSFILSHLKSILTSKKDLISDGISASNFSLPSK